MSSCSQSPGSAGLRGNCPSLGKLEDGQNGNSCNNNDSNNTNSNSHTHRKCDGSNVVIAIMITVLMVAITVIAVPITVVMTQN